MTERRRLEGTEIQARLAALPGWELREEKLAREYRFADFVAAFGFMTRLALEAEKADHHPDWSNVYDRVVVQLWTHSVGGLSEADFALAHTADRLAR